jgi:CRP/FNR family transcriptional regulator, cyclic AMP receptor protein
MAADTSFLSQIQLFAQLDEDERNVLAQAMAERTARCGEPLFRIGDPGDSMFIVQAGKVELFVKDNAGQKIVLHDAVSGDFFGELSLLDGGSRTASATCLEDSQLYVLDREDLLQLFRKRPDAALDMLAVMGRMTRKANALLRERVSKNVNEQVQEERSNIILRTADFVANFSGSITFLLIHVVLFAFWLAINLTHYAFDPFPFGLLTMAVSLEAIILSTLLLFSSNRQGARDRIRADIEYEINMKAELEVAHLHEKTDKMCEEMLERLSRIEKAMNRTLRTA